MNSHTSRATFLQSQTANVVIFKLAVLGGPAAVVLTVRRQLDCDNLKIVPTGPLSVPTAPRTAHAVKVFPTSRTLSASKINMATRPCGDVASGQLGKGQREKQRKYEQRRGERLRLEQREQEQGSEQPVQPQSVQPVWLPGEQSELLEHPKLKQPV